MYKKIYEAFTDYTHTSPEPDQTHSQWVLESTLVSDPVCDMHGHDLKPQLGGKVCKVWGPQNCVSTIWLHQTVAL